MQHVLVHIDKGLGPVGAWAFQDGKLRHFYPDSLDFIIPARARHIMAERDERVSVPDWFSYIAEHYDNIADTFESVDLELPLELPAIVMEFRRAWSPT